MKIPRTIAIPLLILPWALALGMLGWIVVNRFPPNGTFGAVTFFDGKSPFLNPFLPSERVSVPGLQPDGWIGQRLTGDPVYMTARVPGPYEYADIEIDFRSIRQPLIEFGVVRDAAGNDLDLSPMYSSQLASESWQKTANGFERTDGGGGTATWDATTTMPELSDPAGIVTETQTSLRGSHDFYLVPAGGKIDITFALQDVNRKRGTTVAAFRVFRGDLEIKRESFTTNASRETTMGKVVEHRITQPNIGPGVYRVAVQADDDVFIRAIRTTSRRWVVGPRLNFGDVVGYATTTLPGRAWTTSRHIIAETLHREGLQTVSLGPLRVNIPRTHQAVRLDRTDAETAPVLLFAPAGDVRFVGDGWFALRSEAFFEPNPKRLTDGTDLELEGITSVVTPYERPEDLGNGWMKARFRYALDGSQDRLRFILSAPGIASRAGAVDVGKMRIIYHRDPLSFGAWVDLIEQEARNAWRRL